MIVQSLLVINLSMAAPHQLLAEGHSDTGNERVGSSQIETAVPPPPPGPYRSTALQPLAVEPPAMRPPVMTQETATERPLEPAAAPSALASPTPRPSAPYPDPYQQPVWQPLPPPARAEDRAPPPAEPHGYGGYAQPSPWLPLERPRSYDYGYGYGYEPWQAYDPRGYAGGAYPADPYRPPAGYYPPPPPGWVPRYPPPQQPMWNPPRGDRPMPAEQQPPVWQR